MIARGIAARWLAGSLLATTAAVALLVLPAGNAATAALPSGNLVMNPGAESPIGAEIQRPSDAAVMPRGWQDEEVARNSKDQQPGKPVQSVRYGSHQFVLKPDVSATIGGGRTFFNGGYPSGISKAFQVIDVSSSASDIDGGGVKACFSAYLGGGQERAGVTDAVARADLEFVAEDDSVRGRLTIGPVTKAHRKDAPTLLWRASERAVPAGTRKLRVLLTLTAAYPSNNAMADNIVAALTKGRCVPQLAVGCQQGALLATVTPSDAVRTQRVRFQVKGKKGQKLVNARAPYTTRVPMTGLTGQLTVTATVAQPGNGNVILTKKSRRC